MMETSLMSELDPFYLAMLYYRINKIEQASAQCTKILEKNPLDQVFETFCCYSNHPHSRQRGV